MIIEKIKSLQKRNFYIVIRYNFYSFLAKGAKNLPYPLCYGITTIDQVKAKGKYVKSRMQDMSLYL
jgi:hypothetical protein